MVRFTSWPLYPPPQRKSPLYLLNSRMEVLQSRLGRVRGKYTTITGNRTRCFGHPSRSLDTVSYAYTDMYVCVCVYMHKYIRISHMLLCERLKLNLMNITDFLRNGPSHKSFISNIKPSVCVRPKTVRPKTYMPLYKRAEYSVA